MASDAITSPGRFQLRSIVDRENILGGIFLAPAILYITLLIAVPFFIAIAFSVSDVTVGDTTLDFVGFQNFSLILRDPQFIRALQDTILFTIISQVLIILLANIVAAVFTQEFRGKWLARMLIMLPWATPISLGVIGWLWMLDSKFSPFDWILVQMNLLGPDTLLGPGIHLNFLGREGLAMASVIFVYVWRNLPLASVILMAGLTSIDKDLIDQAQVDGARFWRIHFRIKIPLILPIMYIALLFSLVFTFTDMAVVFVLTRGGPVYYTQVLAVWAFFKGIQGGALGEGAAVALFFFPVLLAVAILLLRLARRTEVT
jgi:multiple sugar transport system permease protein